IYSDGTCFEGGSTGEPSDSDCPSGSFDITGKCCDMSTKTDCCVEPGACPSYPFEFPKYQAPVSRTPYVSSIAGSTIQLIINPGPSQSSSTSNLTGTSGYGFAS